MKKNTLDNGEWFFGYLDDTGVIRVQPYINDRQIQNIEQLPFCRGIFDPFRAKTKHQAQLKIAEWLTEQQITEAKQNSWTQQFSEAN